MVSTSKYEISFWQDEIEYDKSGRIVHHPLNSRYFITPGKDTVSYGHLTFAGHDLDKSSILDDIKVFYLEFNGDSTDGDDHELWANPLRAKVLQRLSTSYHCWYMSMIDIWSRRVSDEVTRILGKPLNHIEVESEKPFGSGYGFRSRQFLEIPNADLFDVIKYFWLEATPSYPIEGYNMETGQIGLLKEWNKRPRNDDLFKEVMDHTFINFYTFPAEHRYFVFLTNKLSEAELAAKIGLEDLQARANEIGNTPRDE